MKHRFIITSIIAAFSMLCMAQVVTINYSEQGKATIEGKGVEGLDIMVEGNKVSINDKRKTEKEASRLTFALRGKTEDGSFTLKSEAKTKILLEGVDLTSREGAPIHLKNKKHVEIESKSGTENRIAIAACTDTAKNKSAAIWAKGKVRFSGDGALNVQALGNGCKGINSKDDIDIADVTLCVVTHGDNLGVDSARIMKGPMGPPMGGMPPHGMQGMQRPDFPPHGMQGMDMPHPMRPDMERNGENFPPSMPPGKQKYISTCKGIKAQGTVRIHSGRVTVETNSNGAEGIEGKDGVVVSGGTVSVKAMDDGINSDGKIVFSGGKCTIISIANDAVDSNHGEKNGGGFPFMHMERETGNTLEPAIIISGGEVMAWSMNGPPEEGLDCYFSPIEISGGCVFSIGAGMGDMPSVPTAETAKQPTALVVGLNFTEGEPVEVTNEEGTRLLGFDAPFTFQRSSSLISCPDFKLGGTYTVRSGKEETRIKIDEPFTIIR